MTLRDAKLDVSNIGKVEFEIGRSLRSTVLSNAVPEPLNRGEHITWSSDGSEVLRVTATGTDLAKVGASRNLAIAAGALFGSLLGFVQPIYQSITGLRSEEPGDRMT